MSILINMEMPNKKNGAVLIIYPDGKCAFEDGKTYQAVTVPPHGRFIDADALINEMDKQENAMYEHGREFSFSFKSGGDVCTAWYNVEMMVEDAPAIIEAEEENE